MWYTIPQDKETQKQALDFFGEVLYEDYYTEEVRQSLEELMEVYTGARPFDPEAAYEKLYTIYSEMDMGDMESKEEFFAEKQYKAEDFQKDFQEMWKDMSYKALTNGGNVKKAARDEFLQVFDELHASKKMSDQDIVKTGEILYDVFIASNDDRHLRDNIAELEKFLGNKQNADDIYLGVRDSEAGRERYVRNRMQIFRQFAQGDVEDIRAYTPFYDTMDKIWAKKAAPEDEVKKVDAAMHDESLQDMRKRIKEAFAQHLDPAYGEISNLDRSNASALKDALATAKERIDEETANGERDKDSFFHDVTHSFEDAVRKLLYQQRRSAEEYNDMLQQNQKVLRDIKKKIQDDPDIADYEDNLTDEVAKFEQALNAQLEKIRFPSWMKRRRTIMKRNGQNTRMR